MKTAEELCKRTLGKDEDTKRRKCLLIGREDIQSKVEMVRKKNMMKERQRLRIWDPASGNHMRIQVLGDSNWVVNWMNGKLRINNQNDGAKDAEHARQSRHSPYGRSSGHVSACLQRMNQEADHLTHVARK